MVFEALKAPDPTSRNYDLRFISRSNDTPDFRMYHDVLARTIPVQPFHVFFQVGRLGTPNEIQASEGST